jgi:hypothetical protein
MHVTRSGACFVVVATACHLAGGSRVPDALVGLFGIRQQLNAQYAAAFIPECLLVESFNARFCENLRDGVVPVLSAGVQQLAC